MKEGLHSAVAAFCSRHIHRGDSRGPRLRLRLRRPAGRSLARIRRFRPDLGVRTWCRRLQHVAWDQLLPKRRHTEAEMMLAKVRPIAQDRLAEG